MPILIGRPVSGSESAGRFVEGTVIAGIVGAATRVWRSRWTRRLGSAVLFVWFAYWTWQVIGDTFSAWPYHLDVIGVDGRLYYRAAAGARHSGTGYA